MIELPSLCAVLDRCVREHFGVAGPTEPHVLHPHDIDMCDAALKATEEVVVEVLVREESNHRA